MIRGSFVFGRSTMVARSMWETESREKEEDYIPHSLTAGPHRSLVNVIEAVSSSHELLFLFILILNCHVVLMLEHVVFGLVFRQSSCSLHRVLLGVFRHNHVWLVCELQISSSQHHMASKCS